MSFIFKFPGILFCCAGLLLLGGCATKPKVGANMSEHMRQLAEMRDTCTQYAAWVGRDFSSTSPQFKRSQQLYIEASSAANSYIEALQFDVLTGAPYSEEKYADIAKRVHDSSDTFLKDARQSLGVNQSRGLPLLLIPLAESLIELGKKVNIMVKENNQQKRDSLVKSIGEKRWKPFNELVR